MKDSRFSDSQIMDALKRVESGIATADICWGLSVSTAAFCKGRAKFGGMDIQDESTGRREPSPQKMHMEEKIKAEIVAEALVKKR